MLWHERNGMPRKLKGPFHSKTVLFLSSVSVVLSMKIEGESIVGTHCHEDVQRLAVLSSNADHQQAGQNSRRLLVRP